MAYQIYFADLTEENKSLLLTLLRLKEESGRLEPGEAELLAQMRGPMPFPVRPPEPIMAEPNGDQQRGIVRRFGGRRRFEGARPQHQDQRQERRPDQRPDQRPEQRQDQRPEQRQERRPDQRQDQRPEQRQDQRSEQRQEQRPEQRQEQPRLEPPESRADRHADRPAEQPDRRMDVPDEPRGEPA